MKHPSAKLILLPLLVLGMPANAEEVHRTLDVNAKPEVRIFNTAGDIVVSGWSRKQVEIDADLGSGVRELVVESDGNEVLIEVKIPKNSGRNASSDLSIKVPEGSSLKVGSVSADITIDKVTGWQSLDTVSGDIETFVFANDVEAGSVSGDILLKGNDKSMRTEANTVSGDIDVRDLAGEIELGAVSGDVSVVSGSFATVDVTTVNGDVDYEAELLDDGRMHLETVNGSVTVRFPGKVSARFDIETFNGGINNCFGPDAVRTSKYAPGRELKFTEGAGDARVIIRTLNGTVRVCND